MSPVSTSSIRVSRELRLLEGTYVARTVVWLDGEHNASTVPALWVAMSRAAALDDPELVVDLSGVRFMDASTVGVVVRTRTVLGARSRSLVLRAPSRCARAV